MKILRVTQYIYPDMVGGAAIHVHELSKSQAMLGHDVNVYSINTNNQASEENIYGYKLTRFNYLLNVYENYFSSSLLRNLLKDVNKYDVVHAHSHLFISTLFTSTIRKIIGKRPLIITSHGLYPVSGPEILYKIYIPTVAKFIYKNCDKILCYTEIEKKELEYKLDIDSDKIVVVKNGINTRDFKNNPINHEKIRLLWTGRMVERKGLIELLHCFLKLNNKYNNIELLLVGDGPLNKYVADFRNKYNLSNVIKIIKSVPYYHMANIYNSSDIFILPSYNEGVPRSMLEAMSCGLPVVISKIPHLIDIVKNNGLSVKVGDVNDLYDAVSKLIEDDVLRKKYGTNGSILINKNYNWDTSVKQIINVYKNLIE